MSIVMKGIAASMQEAWTLSRYHAAIDLHFQQSFGASLSSDLRTLLFYFCLFTSLCGNCSQMQIIVSLK